VVIQILQWLSFCARPLSPGECAEVAAIDVANEPVFDQDDVLAAPLEASDICDSLVTISTDKAEGGSMPGQEIVTLAHHSIREYLVSDRIKESSASQYSLREIECQVAIAKGCLGYLNQIPRPASDDVLRTSALALYAAKFWAHHLQRTGDEMKEVSRLAMSLLSSNNPAYLMWLRLHDPDDPSRRPDFSIQLESVAEPLYYGALMGFVWIVESLMEQGADVNADGGKFGTALQAASAKGHQSIVEILIKAGADINAWGGKHGNALHSALAESHVGVVKLLVEAGADVNTPGGEYTSALQAASHKGHEAVIEILVNAGAEIDAPGEKYGTPLQAASLGGYSQIVKFLLECGAYVGASGGEHGSSLQAASAGGHEQIVRMLLDRDPGINAQDGRYIGALQAAEENGNSDVTKLLLDVIHVHGGLRTAPTDSGYASQKQGESLDAGSIQNSELPRVSYPEEDKGIQVGETDDIWSVASDRESIGSKIATNRSRVELLAIKHLASFFSQLEDLRSLHELVIQKMERTRFTQNYRRILKFYYRRLQPEAETDAEKQITKVLRSRRNRESIASGIADYLQPVDEEEARSLADIAEMSAERQYLDDYLGDWLKQDGGPSDEAVQELIPDDQCSEPSDSDSGLEDDSEADYMNISRVQRFLQQGSAFRSLVLDIRLLMLPGPLRDIVETTPTSSIQILAESDNTWANRTKASVETYTGGLEWDWWPLAPRMPSLDVGERCLQWKVGGLSHYMRHFVLS